MHNHKEIAYRKLEFQKCYYNRHDNDITKLTKLIFGFYVVFCQNPYCSSITYTTITDLYANDYWLFIFLQTLTCFNQLMIIIRRSPPHFFFYKYRKISDMLITNFPKNCRLDLIPTYCARILHWFTDSVNNGMVPAHTAKLALLRVLLSYN
jgi:hypothetical protein